MHFVIKLENGTRFESTDYDYMGDHTLAKSIESTINDGTPLTFRVKSAICKGEEVYEGEKVIIPPALLKTALVFIKH